MSNTTDAIAESFLTLDRNFKNTPKGDRNFSIATVAILNLLNSTGHGHYIWPYSRFLSEDDTQYRKSVVEFAYKCIAASRRS